MVIAAIRRKTKFKKMSKSSTIHKLEYHCPRDDAIGNNANIAAIVPASASHARADFFDGLTNGSTTMTAMPKIERTSAGKIAAMLMVARFIGTELPTILILCFWRIQLVPIEID